MSPMPWPPEWETLRAAMTRRVQGEVPPDSLLIEFPIVENSRRREDPPELEWMIFEVNEDYLSHKTMPRLVAEYLCVPNGHVDLSPAQLETDPSQSGSIK